MSLKIKIDVQYLAKQCKEFAMEVEHDLRQGVANLSALARGKIVDLSGEKLHSTRNIFLKNLSRVEEPVPGVFVITLNEAALFIEEGMDRHDMKPDLLKDAKTGKNGRYKIIPFEHSKLPQDMTGKQQNIVQQIRDNLKKEKPSFQYDAKGNAKMGRPSLRKIEYNSNGDPRLGKLHTFSWGGEKPGKGNTGVLQRVNIYQSKDQVTGKVNRSVFTFRTVTDKQTDKWVHPGVKAAKILDEAGDWAEKEFENEILPKVLAKWK